VGFLKVKIRLWLLIYRVMVKGDLGLLEFILALIGVAMLSLTFVEYRRRKFRLGALLLWLFPWALLVLGSIYPPFVWFMLEILSLGLPIHIAEVLSIAVLFSIVYILYIRVVDLESKLRTLVQSRSIEQLESLERSSRRIKNTSRQERPPVRRRSTRRGGT